MDAIAFDTPDKLDTQKLVWKRILSKAYLTKRECYVVMGLLSQLLKKN